MSIPSSADAYRRIRRWIVEGHLRPGERLVEQRLAEDLQLSRTPVREALRMLQSEGLVAFEPNRGARVRELTRGHIADLYELRARLEAMAAELAALRATPEERTDLVAADRAFAVRSPGKYLADLFELGRQALAQACVERVYGGHDCTFSDPARFYSFRRDRTTGRHAALIWRV